MTFWDLIALVIGSGGLSGLIIYLLSRRLGNVATVSTITKTNKEVEQLEQEIESKYAAQVKKWLEDLQEIENQHKITLAQKDADIMELHKQYLLSIKEISIQKLKLDRFNRATRKILVNMDIPYWECDKTGKLDYVNGAWLKMFGLTQKEALNNGWLEAVPEAERENLLIQWSSRIVDQSEDFLEFNILNPLTKNQILVRALYAIILDEDNNIHRIIGVTIEVPKYALPK